MNEMAVHIRYQVDDAGEIEHRDPRVINRRLRRTLHNRDGYAEPLDLVARWIESRGTA